jgi:DNA-binding transcriptional MerR regulator
MSKTEDAFRTISEVADELGVPKHVLRFWESRFPQIRPMKRGGGRRYYRPEDLALLRGICHLLHEERYTIKGVQRILRDQGVEAVKRLGSEVKTEPRNGEVPAKRGRRTRMPAPVLAHPAPPAGASASAKAAASLGGLRGEARAQMQAAIAELEVCRSILLGRAIETSARRRPGKIRRAARP